MINWRSQDAVSGLLFLAIAAYVAVASLLELEIGRLDQMGAG